MGGALLGECPRTLLGVLGMHRFAGAVGYALPGGDLDTCIAIRTIVVQNGVAHLQAGAGVTLGSTPEGEYQECMNKVAALKKAVETASEL